jgi:hypothetical protein
LQTERERRTVQEMENIAGKSRLTILDEQLKKTTAELERTTIALQQFTIRMAEIMGSAFV